MRNPFAVLYRWCKRIWAPNPFVVLLRNAQTDLATQVRIWTFLVPIRLKKTKKNGFGPFSSTSFVPIRAVLRGHQKAVFQSQKRTTFDVKNSTYSTFYVGHSTRQGISLLRVPNRITHDVQPHTSQLHSVQLTLIFTVVRYFE